MPTTIATGGSDRYKPTFASSAVVGLCVRANGDEETQVIDINGSIWPAGIAAPTVAPLLLDGAGPGSMSYEDDDGNPLYVAYVFVYAAVGSYPTIENAQSIGGSLAPRSNPSPYSIRQVPSSGMMDVTVSTPDNRVTGRPDLTEVWIFRTKYFSGSADADNAAQAGELYYINKLLVPQNNDGTGVLTYHDIDLTDSGDRVELDNFFAPTMQFVVFIDPYWWGFGNFPLSFIANWDASGNLTVTDGTKIYKGHNGQPIRLQGITRLNNGAGTGMLYFKRTSDTGGVVTIDRAGTTPADLGIPGSGVATLQGPATTLFRSKRRNPFSWGWTLIAGEIQIPQEYAFKVGGGQGTGIAQVPNAPYLVLSCENPTAMYALDLRLAGTDSFESSIRPLSDTYSVSSHWSQFAASKADGSSVLWGFDAKNFCIIQVDGMSIIPISQKVSQTLRTLTTSRARQLLIHGIYDSYTQLNCLWIPTRDALALVNLLVAQHAPSGNWSVINDQDVLCSAAIQNVNTDTRQIYIGTESGLLGQALVPERYNNWLPDGITTPFAICKTGTTTSITIPDSMSALPTDIGLVGAWALITDADNYSEQWARISSLSNSNRTINFDRIYSFTGGSAVAFNPVPSSTSKFYLGLIEVRLKKYFDLGDFSEEKKVDEAWFSMAGVDPDLPPFLRYFRDRDEKPATIIRDGINSRTMELQRVKFSDATLSQQFFSRSIPDSLTKIFGLEIIERSYGPFQLFSWLLKGSV